MSKVPRVASISNSPCHLDPQGLTHDTMPSIENRVIVWNCLCTLLLKYCLSVHLPVSSTLAGGGAISVLRFLAGGGASAPSWHIGIALAGGGAILRCHRHRLCRWMIRCAVYPFDMLIISVAKTSSSLSHIGHIATPSCIPWK